MGVEGLTYHEKKALGFGTVKQRLGKVLLLSRMRLSIQAYLQSLQSIESMRLLCCAGLCWQLLRLQVDVAASCGKFACCCRVRSSSLSLCLHVHQHIVVQDPVCTPEGFIFSKEAIIENLVQQKKAIKRKHAAWEAQQAEDQQKVTSNNNSSS